MIGPGARPIRLSAHARLHLTRRGFTESEVEETIRTGSWLPIGVNRWEAAKEFPYNDLWNGRRYATKRVRPIFVETATEILVVTVYTYFF